MVLITGAGWKSVADAWRGTMDGVWRDGSGAVERKEIVRGVLIARETGIRSRVVGGATGWTMCFAYSYFSADFVEGGGGKGIRKSKGGKVLVWSGYHVRQAHAFR